MLRYPLAMLLAMMASLANLAAAEDPAPNLIFIMADDLGYGDLQCYGQQVIQTPRLDQMAEEGLRFTQFYAGNTVCAPSRSVLMTGQHMGHTHVRGNARGDMMVQSLRTQDVTVADVLHNAGYTNALIGKWGLGEMDQPGHPLKKGFDRFFGYLNQVHAHNYYPRFVWDDLQEKPLRNIVEDRKQSYAGFSGGVATKRVDYTHDLFVDEALDFITQQTSNTSDKEESSAKAAPFFLYLSLTIPHANNEASKSVGGGAEVPDYGIYEEKDWPLQDKGQAAMITRMDSDVGRILDELTRLGIAENTLVFFTSDNGPHDESGHDPERFDPAGPLRGMKRDLYEGGIRVPAIAWWPGTVKPATTDHICYAGDWMATVTQLSGGIMPPGTDSLSFAPTLLGEPDRQEQHEYLYWEFYEKAGRQAVRFGDWKAIREPMFDGPVELFNLANDIGEQTNVAEENPRIVEEAMGMMKAAHRPHPDWKVQ